MPDRANAVSGSLASQLQQLTGYVDVQGMQKRRQRPDPASQGAAATQGRGSRGKRRRKIRMPLADGSFQPGAAEEGPEDADMMDIDDAVVCPFLRMLCCIFQWPMCPMSLPHNGSICSSVQLNW